MSLRGSRGVMLEAVWSRSDGRELLKARPGEEPGHAMGRRKDFMHSFPNRQPSCGIWGE